jgi:transcription initiation factor TFIID subunit 6
MRFFSKFIHNTVAENARNLGLLWAIMRLTRAILVNPNLDKELYLHQLLPSILTCIVHKELCNNFLQDHWALRRYAAELLPIIVYGECGQKYETVKARVTKTLHEALIKNDCPMTTQYGAIVAITAMGPLTIQAILLPMMRKSLMRYSKVAAAASSNEGKRMEAQQCLGAMQAAFGQYVRGWNSPVLSSAILLDVHLKPARAAIAAIGEPALPWTCSSVVSDECEMFV